NYDYTKNSYLLYTPVFTKALCKSMNFSNDSFSARIRGSKSTSANASVNLAFISSSLPKAVIKLFHNVLRRIVNPTLNNLNSCFSLCGKTSNGSRGVKETIAESTFGLGIKAVLETVNANVASTR